MPGKVKVKIVAGRNLPVMDRSSDTTDAYVEVKLGNTTFKTDVCRKSLNPQWNSEWYRFEMDDAELQDEPLQIRLMDHDTYSANDAIGKVYLDLNPLLLPSAGTSAKNALSENCPASTNSLSGGNTMSGWFPVYDTMHGIRGEVNVIVKVELFSDFNKFRQSSCGVQFFNSCTIPHGYHAQIVHGMVEELVVSDDPEYQWIDKIRTPRASNEARQTLFFKLSGEVQRKIGLKVLDIGGNAVIGYLQCFDLEAECGIVVRGLGTAVSLVKVQEPSHALPCQYTEDRTMPEEAAPGLQPVTMKASQSPIKLPAIHRRSSDSDLSITPKGNSLTSSGDRSSVAGSSSRAFQSISAKLAMKKEPIEAMEFPFLTMNKFPPGFIVNIAGTVASRSVKLLERVSNQEEPESRDAWWTELRMEVRSHMRALSANALIGYSETTTICDDVCVLSASGTAAVVNVRAPTNPPVSDTPEPPTNLQPKHLSSMTTSLDRTEFERQGPIIQSTPLKPDNGGGGGGGKVRHHSESTDQPEPVNCACSVCHLPFNPSTVPLPMTAIKCGVCGKRKVPDLLLATIEPLEGLSVVGRSCLIHVFVTRPKQHARGEMNACVVSDSLPFIEYDIYKQLVNKLKVNGMNAVFGLKTQICLGERMIAAVTSGTAMFLEALPPPSTPTITPGEAWNEDSKLSSVLKGLQETVKKNRDFYQVRTAGSTSQDTDKENSTGGGGSDTEESEDELPDIDIHAGNKEACVFMVDDEQDIEIVSQLIDPHPPEGFFVTSTEGLPGLDELEVVRNLQMFTQIWRSRIPSSQPTSSMHKHFHKLLQGIYYKLRRMTPCAVGNIKFRLALPEPDEMQISIVGMAVGLGEGLRNVKSVRRRTVGASSKPESVKKSGNSDDGDMIFSLEEDQESSSSQVSKTPRPKSPAKPTRQSTHLPPKERYGVDITPLSYIPGGRIERYLGNLNFFFIRETSCIREGGGLSGFVHSFVAEVLAIIRAHVTALGGNALVAFFLNECIILNNPHKNHGQCLINVGGDAVSVSYLD